MILAPAQNRLMAAVVLSLVVLQEASECAAAARIAVRFMVGGPRLD